MAKVGEINRNFPKSSGKGNYDLNKYVAAFAIATLMFIIGLLVGNYLSNQKLAKINDMEEAMKMNLISVELQSMLLQQEPCSPITSLEGKLFDIDLKIRLMEEQLGKTDKQVIDTKKYYSLLELEHYFLMKDRKGKCGGNYSMILFFYSNAAEKISESEKQGYVLDSVREEYGLNKIKIYSLDKDLDLDIIKTLVEFYNVTDTPTLVINDKIYPGFQSKEKVIGILKFPASSAASKTNTTSPINTKNLTNSTDVIILK